MRSNCQAAGVRLTEATIETPGAIVTEERYHAPLKAEFDKMRADVGRDTSDIECLKMAVFATNCTTGPE